MYVGIYFLYGLHYMVFYMNEFFTKSGLQAESLRQWVISCETNFYSISNE